MPLAFYKVLHVLAVLLVLAALGAHAGHAASGQPKDANPLRKLIAALHGTGLLLALVGGFGGLARIGIEGAMIPGWAWAKMVIWLLFAGAIAVPYRAPHLAKHLLWGLPVLGGIATYLAIYKPF
ncbi:MAG TPA: hypothetical protein VMT85_18630 [Thermoanaerobaculia bacterium]|nr:hypothetical protein [Thermoanaerobaculia bacterium]